MRMVLRFEGDLSENDWNWVRNLVKEMVSDAVVIEVKDNTGQDITVEVEQ